MATTTVHVRWAWAAIGLLTLSSKPAASASPSDAEWRQILQAPRVGGRLTAIAVDPDDPLRVFVGTEAGTVILSSDGGITWTEVDIDARVVMKRSSSIPAPGLPRLGKVTKGNFSVKVDPPWRRPVDRIAVSSVANPFPIRPSFFWAGFLAMSPAPRVNLLKDVIRSRIRETQPVKRIAICPGGLYELLVATNYAVYGSMDGGLTYVRLFANPGRLYLDHALCSPADPNHIAVATNIGLFLSSDGGLTFDQDLTAWPGKKSTAVAYAPPRKKGEVFLFSAAKADLFAGHPDSREGLSNIYPTDPSTAPWRTIRWIAADRSGAIYLATDDGARVSHDRGRTWKVVARTLLARQAIGQVEIGEAPNGSKRVAVMVNVRPRSLRGKPVSALQNSLIYASDDNGQTFFPFFSGLSRRTLRQVAKVGARRGHPSGWWVVTSGEVWTTYPRPAPALSPTVGKAAKRWARHRLATTPGLKHVLRGVLDRTHLSNEQIQSLGESLAATGLIPKVELYATADFPRMTLSRLLQGPATQQRTRLQSEVFRERNRDEFFALVQLSWNTGQLLKTSEDFGAHRRRIHILRRQVELAAEDSYHERLTLLHELADGQKNRMQIETLRTRILSLEAILSTWMREPFPGTQI